MHPIVAPGVTVGSLGLCNFVCMVGEGIIYAAAVDIHVLAKVLTCDAGAFDVPAGIAYAPGGIPL